MPWTFDEIERDWLRRARIAYPPDAVAEAFDLVERKLGRTWMEQSRTHSGSISWGAAPTLNIVCMGQMLAALEGADGADKVVARIKGADRSAYAELTAVYLLRGRRPSVALELGPEAMVGGATRRPDIRFRRTPEEPWMYVEVTQPDMSEDQGRVQALMTRFANLVRPVKKPFAMEIFLRREPTEVEAEALGKRVPELCVLEGAVTEELPDGLGFLFLNSTKPGLVTLEDPPGEEKRPRLGMAMAITGPDEPHRHIAVRIAFSDERAERFLRTEARQLPTDAPGLVLVQMSGAPGGFKTWEGLLRRRFQPDLHTRVSAVCLFGGGLVGTPDGEKWLPETKLLVNQYARFALPQWLADDLTEAGAAYEKLLGRKDERNGS